jgi:hypothetical protein
VGKARDYLEQLSAKFHLPSWLPGPVVEITVVILGLIVMRAVSGVSHDDLQVLLFYHYGHAFWFGNPAFQTLPKEYPPLSLLLFTLSVLPPLRTAIAAVNVFTFWMALLAVLSYILYRRFEGARRARLCAVALLIAAGSVLLISYDLAPALATLGALWATQRKRFTLAYALLAVGILLKLYPVFLLPVVVIEQWLSLAGGLPGAESRVSIAGKIVPGVLRGLGTCVGIVVIVFAGSFLLSVSGTVSEFRFASDRPLQFESIPAALLWMTHFFGVPVQISYGFGAFNWASPDDGPFKLLSVVLLVAGCFWVYWRQLTVRLGFGQAFLACLCVVVATNKVLSPQYFIWLIPIVVAMDAFDSLWLVICGLTLLEYPVILPLRHHLSLNTYYSVVELLLIVRNGLLVLATLRAILRPAAIPAHWTRESAQPAQPAGAVLQPEA